MKLIIIYPTLPTSVFLYADRIGLYVELMCEKIGSGEYMSLVCLASSVG